MERIYDLTPLKCIRDSTDNVLPMSDKGWHGNFVSHCIPRGFEAYCKILHPVYKDPDISDERLTWAQAQAISPASDMSFHIGGRIRWSEIAALFGLKFHPEFSEHSVSRLLGGYPRMFIGPEEGILEPDTCRRLVKLLEPFTGESDCYFAYDFIATRTVDVDLLFRGTLSDVTRFYTMELVYGAPTYWWTVDKRWCVCTDWDLTFTLFGGTQEMVAALLQDSELECIHVTPSNRVDYLADRLNDNSKK